MKTKDILFPNVYCSNRDSLEDLKKALTKGEWMLCLGAGVSISAGLPTWYSLIGQLTAQILPIEVALIHQNNNDSYYKDVSDLLDCSLNNTDFINKIQDPIANNYQDVFKGINVLEAAEYIRNSIKKMIKDLGNNDEGGDLLEKHINWHMSQFIQKTCKANFLNNLESEEVKKSTLGAVARLMKSSDDSLIHNAITYNYDNLLEEYLRTVSGCPSSKVHSIVKDDELQDLSATDEWNIYHVHGRIPVCDHPDETLSETVILTETDYYKEESISYSWTNIIQSYSIVRANLIFIGFSGTDYNFRRIIRHVEQEKIKSHHRYIFFLVDDIVSAVFSKETDKGNKLSDCIREMSENDHESFTYEKFLINYMIHAQTVYWESHGLTVIWSSIEELASDLDNLH